MNSSSPPRVTSAVKRVTDTSASSGWKQNIWIHNSQINNSTSSSLCIELWIDSVEWLGDWLQCTYIWLKASQQCKFQRSVNAAHDSAEVNTHIQSAKVHVLLCKENRKYPHMYGVTFVPQVSADLIFAMWQSIYFFLCLELKHKWLSVSQSSICCAD